MDMHQNGLRLQCLLCTPMFGYKFMEQVVFCFPMLLLVCVAYTHTHTRTHSRVEIEKETLGQPMKPEMLSNLNGMAFGVVGPRVPFQIVSYVFGCVHTQTNS